MVARHDASNSRWGSVSECWWCHGLTDAPIHVTLLTPASSVIRSHNIKDDSLFSADIEMLQLLHVLHVHTTLTLKQLIVCGLKCHSEDDVYSGPRWLDDDMRWPLVSRHRYIGCTEGPWWYPVQGTLPLLAASLTGVWLVGAHSRETARVQTKPMYQAALLPRSSDIFVSTSNAPVKKSYSCNYGLPLALFIGLFQEGFNRIPFGKNRVLQSPVYFDTHFFVTAERE